MDVPADTITRQRIEIDEKRHVRVTEWLHVKWRFVIFCLFLLGTDSMCNNYVRATSVIYNPIWKYKSFQIEYNFQFIFFQLPTDYVEVVFFTWHGEQSEFSSTLRVKQKKHVSQHSKWPEKKQNSAVFLDVSRVYFGMSVPTFQKKQRAYTTQLQRYSGSRTIGPQAAPGRSRPFRTRANFWLNINYGGSFPLQTKSRILVYLTPPLPSLIFPHKDMRMHNASAVWTTVTENTTLPHSTQL